MKAHELLTDESKWTQGTCARDADGDEVAATSPFAVRWCIVGAIQKCYPIELASGLSFKIETVNEVSLYCQGRGVGWWNDDKSRTFQEVKDLLVKLDI